MGASRIRKNGRPSSQFVRARKIGLEYVRLMDGLEHVDENSSEGREIIAALDQLERLCIR